MFSFVIYNNILPRMVPKLREGSPVYTRFYLKTG